MTQQPSALGLPVFEAPPEDGIELETTCSPAPSAVMSGRYEIHSFTAFPFTGPIDDPSTLEPGPANNFVPSAEAATEYHSPEGEPTEDQVAPELVVV